MDAQTRKLSRFYSFPAYKRRSSSIDTELDEADFFTANEVFPVSVPLNKVQIGSITYSPSGWNDVEVLYELESSDILIRSNIEGDNGEPPGVYRISGVSAADLSLYCIVPGSLESMVSRLILELENDIVFKPTVQASLSEDEPYEDGNHSLKSRVVKLFASAHEAGHFRDILLFLKCENIADLNPELASHVHAAKKSENVKSPKLTFLDFLPIWVLYIPWWVYSKNARTVLQRLMLMYYIFSVIWAFWQLYRHVHVIHVVLEPVIEALKIHLAFVIEYFDWFLLFFTHLWHKYLSPLNVLTGLLLAPIVQAILHLKTFATPVITVVSQCLTSSTVVTSLKALISLFYRLGIAGGSSVWTVIIFLVRPFGGVWKAILNARIAVGTLDFQRLQLSWIFGIVAGSLKSIGNGFAKLVGYTHTTKKRRQAISKHETSLSSTPDPKLRQRRMPMYYNSPLSK